MVLKQGGEATRNYPGLALLSLATVMIGLMVAGPWLTAVVAKVFHRHAGGGSALLAVDRLADNPRAAYRAVSGLVIAVLVGTTLAAIVPAAIAAQSTTADTAIAPALRVGSLTSDCALVECDPDSPPDGLPSSDTAALFTKITAAGATTVVPFCANNQGPRPHTVSCTDLAMIPTFGTAPATSRTEISPLAWCTPLRPPEASSNDAERSHCCG